MGALSGRGKSSIGPRAWEPQVAGWSTKMSGGEAKQTDRGSPSSNSRKPDQSLIKPETEQNVYKQTVIDSGQTHKEEHA